MNSDPKKLIAQKLFFQADKDGSKTLNFEETKKILQQLHIEITKDYLKHLFEKYDKDRNNTIDLNEFQDIISDITQKKEVTEIFQLFSKEAAKIKDLNQNLEIMKESDIWDFFKNVQKEIITLEEIRVLILCLRNITSQKSFSNFINASKLTNEKFMISLSEFSSILFSFNNRIFDPNKEDIYQVFYMFF